MPSYEPRRSRARALMSAMLSALVLVGSASGAPSSTDPSTQKTKSSSLAPRRTDQRVFGAPIQPAILHKRHKRIVPASTAAKTTSRASPVRTSGGHKLTDRKASGSKAPAAKAPASSAADSKLTGERALPPDPAYRESAADIPH